jgi:hypothetical protein
MEMDSRLADRHRDSKRGLQIDRRAVTGRWTEAKQAGKIQAGMQKTDRGMTEKWVAHKYM